MRLTVLSVAYPLAAVGADAVGGAEQVLARLDAALVAAGHRSIVIARADSRIHGELVAVPKLASPYDAAAKAAAVENHRRAIARTLARQAVDLVHLHGVDFAGYLPPEGTPILATLHLPPSWYPPAVFRMARPLFWLNCVSAAQHRAAPSGPALLPPIGNGVTIAHAAPRHARRRFALALGRICAEKGFHLALDAARAADCPLLLAGAVADYPEHIAYFRSAIVPRLDARRRFIGPIGGARKRRLLAAARCLLVPSLVAETSSLVAMEALAAGTPVVAFPIGALPEIVADRLTGFLVRDVAEMAAAIGMAAAIDPAACREAARRRFSAAAMARRYLALYAELARGTVTPPAR